MPKVTDTAKPFRKTIYSRKRAHRLELIAAAKTADPNTATYVSDVTCLRGHTGLRYIANDGCLHCVQFKWDTKATRLKAERLAGDAR
jgi:hypothetical protein